MKEFKQELKDSLFGIVFVVAIITLSGVTGDPTFGTMTRLAVGSVAVGFIIAMGDERWGK